ncbi:MAG TPA: preprotein translocase subunit SecA [Sulfurovum sp.]|jgi:preprotein translocase subunit SecA|nr:MAG: preprotein translocase subunit SecA [Sulfurovum sp. 35-42-20]OYZ25741.1 MAG: preprotein translocase subunit SecA [Sulfurovum sp. 16-42-52]OYZ50270.1 MAG: preprotein translocase subunit SecA [Sulfurovum sp. 24-42-9]OZA44376.1 MAG: preprotein translocase subunit SecA [Sulfurovum sp. 17-42-90]OZA60372.1 MAG: preprotein translocase subunit SecA [Sulfurovum sp. 39-42-12]HQR73320.1 preprotein translocase subunit SecA [Sulfurovum sp.]
MIKSVLKLFGTQNDKIIKNYLKKVKTINALESAYEAMDDDTLKATFEALKQEVKNGLKTVDDVLVDSFAITREAAKRSLGMRHYDVQMVGGLVLNDGNIAEMKTGEGKTLVATLSVVLNAMSGKGVHVVTVNDYLARRDSEEMRPLYEFLGYSVGCIVSGIHHEAQRKAQYDCDITYGTNNEYGFDYLRDNMKVRAEEKVQREHHYAIVDEVDSILIDEARTPLIISGPTQRDHNHYAQADAIAKQMIRGEKLATKPGEPEQTTGDFIVDEKNRTIVMTEEGLQKAQDLFEVENLYNLENAALSHHLDQALKAHYIFVKDVDYVVQNDEIIIVDEFTGRLSEGRRYSEGLHQALEAKESVEIQEESQTLAEITYQNYFRLYKKLAGMTGTAQTEATEFSQIYNLDVISIPTNLPVARIDKNDLIYNTEREKMDAVVRRVKELHQKGQPVLIGTASIEKSEMIHERLKKEKIAHNILNAKNHAQEAEIIVNAGQKAAVTVATNMAGRGVDIKIDDEVRSLGGLMILGTERHESRRIDNQLRGRSGRQGDPGESQFFLSLDDNLLRIFGGEKIRNIMNRLGVEEGEFIDSKIVTRSVEKAQKKVENQHYESRKHILEYDDVANHQRKAIYAFRNQLLDPAFDMTAKLKENRAEYIAYLLGEAEIFAGMQTEDFNTDKLAALIKEELHIEVKSEQFKTKELEEITAMITEMMETLYEAKMSQLVTEQRQEIERILYLQVLDPQWRDHLYEMDVLKTGIGLRGYNQKDPLTEYKQESYKLFTDLVVRIKLEAVKVLQLVQFNFESPQEEEAAIEHIREELESSIAEATLSTDAPSKNNTKAPTSEKKTKRNEPCPCGSGNKYKNCCGQSGPKKGLLA